MNPHAEKAQDALSASKKAYALEHQTLHAVRAQAEASLAIAHEARTANVIALAALLASGTTTDADDVVLEEIAERLDCDLILR